MLGLILGAGQRGRKARNSLNNALTHPVDDLHRLNIAVSVVQRFDTPAAALPRSRGAGGDAKTTEIPKNNLRGLHALSGEKM